MSGGTQSCGTVTIDGHELTATERSNPATASFTNFNSTLSKTYVDDDTWTLTHK